MVASSPAVRVLRNYINGEFVAGGEGFIQSMGPATGDHIADIPRSGKAEVNAGEILCAFVYARLCTRAERDLKPVSALTTFAF